MTKIKLVGVAMLKHQQGHKNNPHPDPSPKERGQYKNSPSFLKGCFCILIINAIMLKPSLH